MRQTISFSVSFVVTTNDKHLKGYMQNQLYDHVKRMVVDGELTDDDTTEIHLFSVLEDTSG